MNARLVGNLKSKTSWFGGILAAAGVLLETAPALVEQYLPALLAVAPPEYGATLTAIGTLIVALRNVTNRAVTDKAAPKVSGFGRPSFLIILAAMAALVAGGLQGCGLLKTISEHEAAASIVVPGLTLKAIEESSDRSATAHEILAEANNAIAWLDFEGVTLDQLVAKTRQRIAESDSELSEKLLYNSLLDVVDKELRKRIDEGALDPVEKTTVNTFLGWIVQAAQAYAK